MARPYFYLSFVQLREQAESNDPVTLRAVMEELDHRKAPGAPALRRAVEEKLAGLHSRAPEGNSGPRTVAPTARPIPPSIRIVAPVEPSVSPPVQPPLAFPPQGSPVVPEQAASSGEKPDGSVTLGKSLPERPLPGLPPIKSAEDLGHGDEFGAVAADHIVDRSIRLFKFLLEMTQQGHEPIRDFQRHAWHLSLSTIAEHPLVRCGLLPAVHEEGIVLEVQRPALRPRPVAPSLVSTWIASPLDDPTREPQVLSSILRGADAEAFDADPSRPAAWQEFILAWRGWAEAERRDRPARELFDHLLKLRDLLEGQGERYQLLVADGLLSWISDAGPIRHPLIARRVDINFDNAAQKITVVDTGNKTAATFDCLRGQKTLSGTAVSSAYAEVRENNVHPLEDRATNLFVGIRNRWLTNLASASRPALTTYPLLILTSSSGSIQPMLEAIVDEIGRAASADVEAARADLPAGLRAVVGEATPTSPDQDTRIADTDPDDPDQKILFTKPANLEQGQIVAHLRRHPSVVVLGPPGTGKTHTIANLIGHFLAEGKTILVTSETAKALGEVREKVVEALQPLCVPLLGTDQESRNELSKCVNGILHEIQRATKAELESRAVDLAAHRAHAGKRLQQLRGRVLAARLGEVTPIVVGDETRSPLDAAKWLAANTPGHDWIPPKLRPGVPCPLLPDDVAWLYASNAIVGRADEVEYESPLPERNRLPDSQLMQACLGRRTVLREAAEKPGDEWLRPAKPGDRADLERLANLIRELPQADSGRWKLTAIEDGRPESPRRSLWDGLVQAHSSAVSAALAEAHILGRYAVSVGPTNDLETSLAVAREVRSHVAGGGGLGFLAMLVRDRWKEHLANWKVDGRSPSRPDDFKAIEVVLAARQARTRLKTLWHHRISSEGGPAAEDLGSHPERSSEGIIAAVPALLTWRSDVWQTVEGLLATLGVDWPKVIAARPLVVATNPALERDLEALRQHVLPLVARRIAQLDLLQVDAEFQRYAEVIESAAMAHRRSRVLRRLSEAWVQEDAEAYQAGLDQLAVLLSKRTTWERRRKLLHDLAHSAPAWAEAIQTRSTAHGGSESPGNVVVAWRWRQLHEELERRHSEDLPELLLQVERLAAELLTVTARLVQARAWADQHDRAHGPARHALQGWLDTMKAIGAGHGRRVPQHLEKANQLMVKARGAVPVWIMPLERVYQVISPKVRPRFDVVIVDEASQVGPEGLALFYLGEKVVIVGDDQQVTPSDVGRSIEGLDQLRTQLLAGVPNAHLFDGKRSLYGLAQGTFPAHVGLREHFRCVPDIIRFSNNLCYAQIGQAILPLRDAGSARVFPPLVAHRVPGVRQLPGKVNPVEARRVTALFTAIAQHPAYRGLTIGVISLLGSDQSRLIDQEIRRYYAPSDPHLEALKGGGGMTRRLCGEPPNFQGDERGVIILSVVDSGQLGGPLNKLAVGTFQSRYNVAASRAQDQLWVVHSLDSDRDLQPDDLRRRLIEHAIDPKRLLDVAMEAGARAESPFEREVIGILTGKGFAVRPQFAAGAYRIDMVVYDGDRRLAVECDGERAHPPEKLKEDVQRQAILERRGWRFARIRGSAFYRDRASALAPLFQRLEELGIRPTLGPGHPETDADTGSELVKELVRRAEQLEEEWASRDAAEAALVQVPLPETTRRRGAYWKHPN